MDHEISHLRNEILSGIEKQLARIANVLETENRIKRNIHEPNAANDEKQIIEITSALEKLGALSDCIEVLHHGDRAKVYLDGEYFGIYDFVRKTFVD